MATIALLGATGSLGRAIGRLLSVHGQPYRPVSRSQMGLQVRFGDPLAEPVLWASDQPTSIRNALEGVETAIYLVGMPVWEFAKHLALTRMVLDAALQAGVQKLLLISSNWSYGPPQATSLTESHTLGAQTEKGRIRREQEELVLAAPGPFATAVLRIADFYGPYVEASYLWSAFKAAKNGTRAQLMSPADIPHEFVYVPDAAQTILDMINMPQIWGRSWNLGGVGITTLRTMTEAIFTQARLPPNYEMPLAWKMRIVAMMNPYVREMREMQYLLETPLLLDDSALAEVLGGLKKTPYAEGIAQTLPTVRLGR